MEFSISFECLYYFLIGLILGIILCWTFIKREKIHGVIEVDHKNNLCNVVLTSNELIDPKKKRVIFLVNHDVTLSREEQVL